MLIQANSLVSVTATVGPCEKNAHVSKPALAIQGREDEDTARTGSFGLFGPIYGKPSVARLTGSSIISCNRVQMPLVKF